MNAVTHLNCAGEGCVACAHMTTLGDAVVYARPCASQSCGFLPGCAGNNFDPAARAAEKQASRDADARALTSGEKSRAQLKTENGAFAFPRDRIRLERSSPRLAPRPAVRRELSVLRTARIPARDRPPREHRLYLVTVHDKEQHGEPDVRLAIVDGTADEAQAIARGMEADLREAGRCRCVASVRPVESGRFYRISALIRQVRE